MKNWQPEQDKGARGEGVVIRLRKRGKWKKTVYSTG